MRGIVFTEFLEMVEERFSPAVADRIIGASDLPSGGSYTSVGTYDHREMLALVAALATESARPAGDLVREFGVHLFPKFAQSHPRFFEGVRDAFEFLERVDGYIHVEVKKLYPDAELPVFVTSRPSPDRLLMDYQSVRGLADLAHGLMLGCIAHFGGGITVTRGETSADSTRAQFILDRR